MLIKIIIIITQKNSICASLVLHPSELESPSTMRAFETTAGRTWWPSRCGCSPVWTRPSRPASPGSAAWCWCPPPASAWWRTPSPRRGWAAFRPGGRLLVGSLRRTQIGQCCKDSYHTGRHQEKKKKDIVLGFFHFCLCWKEKVNGGEIRLAWF